MTRMILLAWAGACVLGLGACGDEDNDFVGPPETSTVRLLLTDAPGDVLTAVVTIDEIYLQGNGGRTTLLDDPATVNLTDLSNTATEVLAGVEVAQGTYDELRFVIGGGYVEVEGVAGTTIYASTPDYPGLPAGAEVGGILQMPSLGSSGLKVQFAEALRFGEAATTLLVDLGGFEAVLGGEVRAFADPDADGTFGATFAFLLPGTYALTLNPPAGFAASTTPALPLDVVVGAGATISQALTLTAVTPTAP